MGQKIYSGYEFDQKSLASTSEFVLMAILHAQAIIQWKEIGDSKDDI